MTEFIDLAEQLNPKTKSLDPVANTKRTMSEDFEPNVSKNTNNVFSSVNQMMDKMRLDAELDNPETSK